LKALAVLDSLASVHREAVTQLAKLRAESDREISLSDFRTLRVLPAVAKANQAFEAVKTAMRVVTDNHGGQASLAKAIFAGAEVARSEAEAVKQEFEDAIATAGGGDGMPLCQQVKTGGISVALSIREKTKRTSGEPARPTGEVEKFSVSTYTSSRFDVVPVVTFVSGASDASEFSVEGGLLRSRPRRSPVVRPGLFAMSRLAETPVWAAAGVSQGARNVDTFLGLAARGGDSWVGEIIVGAGFAWHDAPVGVGGATVNQPLPSSFSNIADVLQFERRPALVVFASLSGLGINFGSGSKP